MNEDSLQYDALIIGAGPSGLACAIQLKQLISPTQSTDFKIAIIEKGASVGAHILSGAVINTKSLTSLLPQWEQKIPHTKVTKDKLLFLTKNRVFPLPIFKQISNRNNIIVSLGEMCKHLAEQAENMGVDILSGVSAKEPLYKDDTVCGILTTDYGLGKQGKKLATFQPGIKIFAKQTIIAEGVRGSIANQLIKKFDLYKDSQPQTYGLGIKELWEIKSSQHRPGLVTHTMGWPLNNKAYGGGFIYHYQENKVILGLITGLDYQNPYIDPFNEMQLLKTHPYIKKLLKNASRLNYGAKSISEGGYQSIPKLTFQGGMLIGDSAGFVNVPKIKGVDNAMQSGIIAAKAVYENINEDKIEVFRYQQLIKKTDMYKDLHTVRNIKPFFKYGLIPGMLYSVLELLFFKGKTPWTFKHRIDRESLLAANKCKKINYLQPDNELIFDKASSLYLSGTIHRDNQDSHLKLKNINQAIEINYKIYDSPESRYCPAGVYEIVYNNSNKPILQINFQNCLHCKACDIKDLNYNIVWTIPEGGEGPNYMNM